MKRQQLEHVLRAASRITDERDVLVIGSQSILGSFDDDQLPLEVSASIEVDVTFFDDPDDAKSDAVDDAIGELSPFHETFGYYAWRGLGPGAGLGMHDHAAGERPDTVSALEIAIDPRFHGRDYPPGWWRPCARPWPGPDSITFSPPSDRTTSTSTRGCRWPSMPTSSGTTACP